LLEGSDACGHGVLTLAEAPHHPHNAARRSFIEIDGVTQPAPAPRFSRTPAATPRPPAAPGAESDAILAEAGFDPATLRAAGVLG
jgi:alpha-methylacyl-CoA racemase